MSEHPRVVIPAASAEDNDTPNISQQSEAAAPVVSTEDSMEGVETTIAGVAGEDVSALVGTATEGENTVSATEATQTQSAENWAEIEMELEKERKLTYIE